MSIIHGDNWSIADISNIFACLDKKTGMHAAEIEIVPYDVYFDLYVRYEPATMFKKRRFVVSLFDFNKDDVSDYKVIEKLRRVYCAYIKDELASLFEEKGFDDSAIIHKTLTGILNIRDRELTDKRRKYDYPDCYYYGWWERPPKESVFNNICNARDVRPVNIREHISNFGINIPCIAEKRELEKKLVNRFTKARVFSIGEHLVHKTHGEGLVIDTLPMDAKQMLLVKFDDGAKRVIQNRDAYKLVNGNIIKPRSKEPMAGYSYDPETDEKEAIE